MFKNSVHSLLDSFLQLQLALTFMDIQTSWCINLLGNGITFIIAHRIADRILQIVKCNQIAIHLYLLPTNPNTDKPIDIQMILNINEY